MNDYSNNGYPEFSDYYWSDDKKLSYEDSEKLKRMYNELAEYTKDLNIKMVLPHTINSAKLKVNKMRF